ncbi:rhodanese-like domain-containing protein [Thiomicrorhabdus sp. Kp2]|uniref:rhodanese-like domain-containing protein n=1 Tax=Thiomicrorhabdus sp. Kp2 TaxID=1123518 RepID=UPI000427A0C3|nr:rhodanese-like domain-containing protein [Thiomicrorhabdus sp. Kp2]
MFSHKKLIDGIGIFCLLMSSIAFAAKGPSPESVDGATTIGAEQAKKLWKQGATFIDTRKDSDWEAGRVPGAVHINIKNPEFNKENILTHIGLNDAVISYCNAEKCHRAASGAKKLVEFGFTKVYYYRDGFPSWKNAGYPYE